MINKVLIIGNLGADPEVKNTQNEMVVTTFNVATTERWKGRDGVVCPIKLKTTA